MSRDYPYTVEAVSPGCPHCGNGTMYAVVFGGEEQMGMQWSDREEAGEWAEAMNMAYDEAVRRCEKAAQP